MCGFASGKLTGYDVVDGRAEGRDVLAEDCRLGVDALTGGRLVYAPGGALRS